MKISTRTRYGIRGLVEVAMHYGEGPLQINVIAERQEISAKYLEQLMAILKRHGFVMSVRGSRGGYMLAKPPSKIRLSEVFCALEGRNVTVECADNKSICKRSAKCVVQKLWEKVQAAVMGVLESYTLQDLIEMKK